MIWLEKQLLTLPPDTRKMIGMRYRLGWSLKRIAQRFGLKTGAVDGRIRRAVVQLRNRAEKDEHVQH